MNQITSQIEASGKGVKGMSVWGLQARVPLRIEYYNDVTQSE